MPKVVTKTETVEVVRERLIAVPAKHTRLVPIIVLPYPLTTVALRLGFEEQREAAAMCNNQLLEIANLGD